MLSRCSLALVAVLASSGCFVEMAAGVTPLYSEALTDASGTTTESWNFGWNLALWVGFQADIGPVSVLYAPPLSGRSSTYAVGDAPNVRPDGHHLRLDVPLPVHHATISHLVLGFDTVGGGRVLAKGADVMGLPDEPVGDRDVEADGWSAFTGIGLQSPENEVGVAAGLTYERFTSPYSRGYADTNYNFNFVPGVKASGLGAAVRLRFSFVPSLETIGMFAPSPAAMERARASSSGTSSDRPLPTAACTPREITECTSGVLGRRCTSRTVCD